MRQWLGQHPWGAMGQEAGGGRALDVPIHSCRAAPGDSRTPAPAHVLRVLLDSGATWLTGKTTALSVMGKKKYIWTPLFLHKTFSSAQGKEESHPVAEFKTDQLMLFKPFYHLQVQSY